jgi:hypothetical protein
VLRLDLGRLMGSVLMSTGLFRARPVVVKAEQITLATIQVLADWCGGSVYPSYRNGRLGISLPTPQGMMPMRGEIGDWLIKDGDGQFTVCPDSAFEATYEHAPSIGSGV